LPQFIIPKKRLNTSSDEVPKKFSVFENKLSSTGVWRDRKTCNELQSKAELSIEILLQNHYENDSGYQLLGYQCR